MKIAIIGFGKLGKAITQLGKHHTFPLRINRSNTAFLHDGSLKEVDVAIEISGPEAAFDNIKTCIDQGIPVVCGSTGWLDRKAEIDAYVVEKGGSFLYASNFSIGVNLFFALNRQLAKWMNTYPEYDIHISETHHTAKKDAPSGTAITLATDISKEVDRKKRWLNYPEQEDEAITIRSLRYPNVPGTHEVVYTSIVDDIEIKHTAHSREGFARGALLAAEWIEGKKGVFTMLDVLPLKD